MSNKLKATKDKNKIFRSINPFTHPCHLIDRFKDTKIPLFGIKFDFFPTRVVCANDRSRVGKI